jgi:multicomponent Na+:H+ antiporter subunit E
MKLFLYNIVLAIMWMFLNAKFKPHDFFMGFLIGYVILFISRKAFSDDVYFKKLAQIINFLIKFFTELLIANIGVAKIVLQPNIRIRPGVIALPLDLQTDWEITTLANAITLTPGTLSIDLSDDGKILYVHSIDIKGTEKLIQSIKENLEKPISEVYE